MFLFWRIHMIKRSTLVALALLFCSVFARAQDDDNMQVDSVHQETRVENEDGSQVRTHKSGRPRSRSGDLRVGEIQSGDVERIRTRVQSLSLWSVSLGPAYLSKFENNNMFYSLGIAHHWDVSEQAEVRLRFNGAAASKDSGYYLGAGIGGAYFFSTTNISPLLGAEFGVGTAGAHDMDTQSGFGGGVFGGVRFFRTATTQLEVLAFYNTIFAKENPGLWGVQLALLY
jgi:hypothetical protein